MALLKISPPTASNTKSAPLPLLILETSSLSTLSPLKVNAAQAPLSLTKDALSSVPQTATTYYLKTN